LAGAATAFLIKQRLPEARVLIVERAPAHGRKVGEATVEVSAYFLTRVLGLMHHLNHEHVAKQGFRFWFANETARDIAECGEIGGRYLVRVPAFQLDRAVLDEEVLRRAVAAGAELWRPAQVQKVELRPGEDQVLSVRRGDVTETVRARWVVDASGIAATLARQNGWWRANNAHPTTAVWSRWRGVRDLDGLELAQKHPEWAQASYGIRATATNHIMGSGWWAWMIPLKGGDVSVGIVFDQRLVEFPEGGSLGARLKAFLCEHPAARELLAEAQWIEDDVHWRRNLPYFSTTFAGDGFALVGDAAGFIDPFYSPGMDWISFTVSATAELIHAERTGQPVAPLVTRRNEWFSRSYSRWFEALYRDKYEYLGEFDLMRLAFLMDLGCYYLGVASQPYKRGPAALLEPVFTQPPSVPVYHFIRAYNRRFAQIARRRRELGLLRRHNAHRRFLFGGYTFAMSSARHILKALGGWGWLELTEGWRSWWQPRPKADADSALLTAPLPEPGNAKP
jgi:flavin-dependent dehydrogenase